ncbi:MAG: hypothetical protein JNM21_00350 [Taibaiella sp.]|nr:hypothetical protein [Taibaiella sp.]
MHLNEQNRQLWERVSAFDIAEYSFNYGFALRLATENKWSFSFTDAAIMEYKKFMFLASISDEMISPSVIVDTVWHLHLIYSDAYQSFCKLLGKEIKHIPSRKQAGEQAKFHAAKLLTQKIYEPVFGTMPEAIWKYESMYDSLNLSHASHSIEKINIVTLVLFPALVTGLYFLLRPVYRAIDSTYFLPAYFVLGFIILLVLRQYNQQFFKRLINCAAPSGFLFELGSLELIALKSGAVKNCVHALTNELIVQEHIAVDDLGRLSAISVPDTGEIAQLKVYEIFAREEAPVLYDKVLFSAIHIPYFQAIQYFVNELRHYINTSKEYVRIVICNYSCLGIFLALGLARVFTGLSAGKPVVYILILVFVFIIITESVLRQLKFRFFSNSLPHHYLKSMPVASRESVLQWDYLQSGQLALTAAFIPVVGASIATNSDHSTSSGSSCGTSCGSSCGSSCGGCGGD